MKKKLSKAGGKALSVVLAAATVVSMAPISVAAEDNVALAEAEKAEGNALRLWYSKPSSQGGQTAEDEVWQQCTLPIGNGDIGANVYGEIKKERLTFNEKTLWTGGPSDKRPNYNGGNDVNKGKNGESLKNVQELFAQGKDAEAKAACDSMLVGLSDGYGAYQSWGNLYFEQKNINATTAEQVNNYVRDLDLTTAVSNVSFEVDGTTYKREFFVSNPDNVLVAHFTADGKEKLDMEITFPSNQNGITKAEGKDMLVLAGEVSDNQLKYDSVLKAVPKNGTVEAKDGKIIVKDATELTVYVSADTDYKNDYPEYRTKETAEQLHARVKEDVDAAAAKGYESVKEDHIEDYSELFSRVDLDLGQTVSDKTTDELLRTYKNKSASEAEQRQLEVMLFQFGRYLTLGSSRENSELPSNLQGVWNNKNNPSWSSDYHMNVNLQMNYWPTYSTNLAECADPLIRYVDSLREPGRVTAAVYAGIESGEGEENGFMAHTQNTPFGWTCPGWAFSWGWSPAAVPWILQNCWEYYEFTGDLEYMEANIYPMLKEEAQLYNQMLIQDSEGKYVSSPSYSPEHGPYTAGNTYEQSLIWQLFEDAAKAAELLGKDEALAAEWKHKQENLKGPIEIGDDGQIKEWYNETTFNKDENGNTMGEGFGHRHLSHMLGLFPGDLITEDTKEWFEAAKVSMNNRTDSSTGWGMGQRINTWARLGDGNRAHKLITDLFNKGIYQNLWDTHPPYQIDGNFGYTSGVSEMLAQSNAGYINLLPALPDVWASGNVDGLVTRGNFELSMEWNEGKLETAALDSRNGGDAIVQYDNISLATVKDSDGNFVEVTPVTADRISFNTEAGKTYTISAIPAEEVIEVPTGLEVIKVEDGKADLTWNPVESESTVSYNVYRQIEDGEWVQVQTEIEDAKWTDNEAYDVLGTLNYKVSAVIDGKESELSAAASITDLRNMLGMIDDQDERIKYTGAWGDWISNEGNYGGSVKYLEAPTGTETAELTFCGTGIEVFSCTQNDRGKLEITIDGVNCGTVDTYSAAQQRQKKVFSTDDLAEDKKLEYGIHTITVRATGEKNASASKAKVELDAFNVLNTEAAKVEKVEVTSASGMTTVSKADSTLQMKAEVTPENALNKDVTWSVETKSGAAATIDENGFLTVGKTNGVVTVKATSKDNAEAVGTVDITIAIPSVSENSQIIEDSVDKANKNPAITWTGNWSTWAGEPEKHHGGTKTETSEVGAAFSYEFTGTGIKLYAQKNNTQGKFTVELDGEPADDAVLWEEKSGGSNQQLVFEKTDLDNKKHTIKFTAAEDHGKRQVNIDYLEVLTPASASVDKSALQDAIAKYYDRNEEDYGKDVWTEFKKALDDAVAGMNDDKTTKEQADTLADALTKAGEKLDASEIPAPEVPEDAKANVMGVTATEATVTWTKFPRAESYKVYAVEAGEGTAKALKALTDTVPNNAGEPVTTTETTVRFTGLKPGTSYKFMIVGVNRNDVESEKALSSEPFVTLAAADEEAPTQVSGIDVVKAEDKNDVLITWEASTDPQGSKVSYIVYVDGVKVSESDKTEFTLKDADENKDYSIRIVAVDAAGNKAVPAVINLTVEDWNAKTVIAVEKLEDITVEKGTAVDKLNLPKTVNVTLDGGRIADTLDVKWNTDNYNADKVGTYELEGELQKKKGVKIPDEFKTVKINVIVEEKGGEVDPPQPEKDQKVTGIVTVLKDFTVEEGTPEDKLNLPTGVKVTLDGKTEGTLQVVWNTDAYVADKAGTYELTGTLQDEDGIEIPAEFKTVKISVTVEKGGVTPPNTDKEDGKDNGKDNSGAVQTGDDKNVLLPIVGIAAAIAIVVAVLVITNKKKK